jgi:serine phosphatase RsbU (regulator of sigma subunit)
MKKALFFHTYSSENLRQGISIHGEPLFFSGILRRQERVSWQCPAQTGSSVAFDGARSLARREEPFSNYTTQLEAFRKEVYESLRYAQSLQNALLQEKEELQELFPGSFILSQPQHVVSGDFYWFKDMGDKVLVCVGDCTGHGIPGALIAMLGLSSLHAAFSFHKIISPDKLLKFLDEDFNRKLSHRSKGKVMNDGMDISICEIDKKEMVLTIAGTGSKVYLVRDGQAEQFKTDRYSIGSGESGKSFEMKRVPIQKGDAIYLSSDGYADQFGGKNGKKLGSRAFAGLLASLSSKACESRETILQNTLVEWQGDNEQTDDVLVMGLSI